MRGEGRRKWGKGDERGREEEVSEGVGKGMGEEGKGKWGSGR